LTNAFVSYVAYLWKAIWPARLAVLYPYPAKVPVWQWLPCLLLLAAASAWIWRERARRPYLIAGWCWFLGTLVPVIGLIQVGEQSMADRYAYIPLIGIYVLAVWGLADLAQRANLGVRRAAMAVAGALLVLFSVLAWQQLRFWQNNLNLWTHSSAVTENNWRADGVFGSLIFVDAINAGQPYSPEAEVHFENAARINPQDPEALASIAGTILRQGHPQEALERFRLALPYVGEKRWLQSRIFGDMAVAYEQLGDYPAARQYFQLALKTSPGPDNADFLGYARTFTDERIAKMNASLAAHPTAQGYLDLGKLQESTGRPDAARASYQKAVQLDPNLDAASQALLHVSGGKL